MPRRLNAGKGGNADGGDEGRARRATVAGSPGRQAANMSQTEPMPCRSNRLDSAQLRARARALARPSNEAPFAPTHCQVRPRADLQESRAVPVTLSTAAFPRPPRSQPHLPVVPCAAQRTWSRAGACDTAEELPRSRKTSETPRVVPAARRDAEPTPSSSAAGSARRAAIDRAKRPAKCAGRGPARLQRTLNAR